MAISVVEIEDALEAIVNVLYLIEVDVDNPKHILEYLKMTDRPVTSLMRLLDEIRSAG